MNTWKELAFSGEGKISTTALYVLEFIFGTNDVLVSEIGATFPKRHTEFRQRSTLEYQLRSSRLLSSCIRSRRCTPPGPISLTSRGFLLVVFSSCILLCGTCPGQSLSQSQIFCHPPPSPITTARPLAALFGRNFNNIPAVVSES